MFNLHCLPKKLAPKRNYFHAISKKIMRQIGKILARILKLFWRHIHLDFDP